MTELNQETVEKLCELCRIDVTPEELPALFLNLKKVIDYIAQLQEVDVSDLDPYSHMETQGIGTLREDEAVSSVPRQEILRNAPDHIGGMVRVPKIMKSS